MMTQLRLAKCFVCSSVAAIVLAAGSALAQGSFDRYQPSRPPIPAGNPSAADELPRLQQRPSMEALPRIDERLDSNRSPYVRTRQRARVIMEMERKELTAEEQKRHREVGDLRKQIRDENDEGKRTELGESLRSKLAEIFDDDLSERDDQLKQLEARVGKLRAAIEKRRKNRDRIITLQVDSVMLEAEGLSFPSIQAGRYDSRSIYAPEAVYPGVPVETARDHVRQSRPPYADRSLDTLRPTLGEPKDEGAFNPF